MVYVIHGIRYTCYTHVSAAAAKSLQLCLNLCDPIDGSPPGSSIPGILQARILEWIAISFSNACMHASRFSHVRKYKKSAYQPVIRVFDSINVSAIFLLV